ncbi:fibropellin-1 isoform X3 [Hydra vulgaris]|uniref:Fibropellin-1 isoform X3 n=1 Tax=Hydra vulgaris TaxID=6087 RepID=A0ABM4D704_HYDVU
MKKRLWHLVFVFINCYSVENLKKNEECQFILNEESGTVKSPRYPKPYSNNLNCSWKITVPNGRQIILTVNKFQIESSYNCESDALYVYDGPNDKANLYSKPYCGTNAPSVIKSKSNNLFLRFITDNLDNNIGFLIQYNSVKICDYELEKSNGTFTSPNFPQYYYANANCSYLIKAKIGKTIVLQFTNVVLENEENGNCLDSISVYDIINNEMKLLKKFCGSPYLIQEFHSSYNQMLVKFHSDDLINKPGFFANYYSLNTKCQQHEFQCANDKCIALNLECNHKKDCDDNSDEIGCHCQEFQCLNEKCIESIYVCDGLNQCGDGSDESQCSNPTTVKTQLVSSKPVICGYADFKCNNDKCLRSTQRCNGLNDCGDNSDESSCIGFCKNSNGGCDHICEYDPKNGVQCSCYLGFKLDSNRQSCIDINECSSRPCPEHCTNEYGSFKCGCNQGFQLQDDQRTCVDIDECASKVNPCEQQCINQVGSFNCTCFSGYSYKNKVCEDINECEINNGGCAEKCINTIGSFICSCNLDGHKMLKDNTSCEDINECADGSSKCDHFCKNTDGSFECSCQPGFYLDHDGKKCVDVNECHVGTPGCLGNCINTKGSYICKCAEGYRSINNETSCEDVNECEILNGGCSHRCENTKGSYICKCREGYTARDHSSFTCNDKNECEDNPCEGTCTNYIGTFECGCETGFQLVAQVKCQDIDECMSTELNKCEHTCVNIPGSYFCTCRDDYVLHSDKMSCKKSVTSIGCQRTAINIKEISSSRWDNVLDGWGWQVSLSIDFTHFTTPRFNCMGILVSEEFILITGHCLRFSDDIRIPPQNILVSLGSYMFGFYDNENNIHASEIIYHPTLDLALIRLLEKPTISNQIQPICLPQTVHDVDISQDKEIIVVTWLPDHVSLRHVVAKIVKHECCEQDLKINQDNLVNQSLCIQFNKTEFHLPMSGSPILGISREVSNQTDQKWLLTGILIRGSYHPDVELVSTKSCVGYYKAVIFVDWIRNITLN